MIVYNDKHIAKVVKKHDGYDLLRITIYHTSGTTTTTDISSTLCQKFRKE